MFDFNTHKNAFVDSRLHKLRVLITEQSDELFLQVGIQVSSSCISILLYLLKESQRNIAQIANALGYSHQLIAHRLKSLEKNDFVKRSVDCRDRRKLLISLTADGEEEAKKISEILPVISTVFENIFRDLDLNFVEELANLQAQLQEKSLGERSKNFF